MKKLILGAIFALGVSGAASAATVTKDRVAWAGQVGANALTMQDFNGVVDGFNDLVMELGGYRVRSIGGVYGTSNAAFCLVPNCVETYNRFSVEFDTPVNFFGILIGDGDDAIATVEVDGVSAGNFTLDGDAGEFTFVGAYDLATPFSKIEFFNPDPNGIGQVTLENLEFGTVAAVPLPPGVALMLLGLGALGVGARRRA